MAQNVHMVAFGEMCRGILKMRYRKYPVFLKIEDTPCVLGASYCLYVKYGFGFK
jgi:hypothetical protein